MVKPLDCWVVLFVRVKGSTPAKEIVGVSRDLPTFACSFKSMRKMVDMVL